MPQSEQTHFPLDPELANAMNGFETMVDGGISRSALVQNQKTTQPTVSKKRKIGRFGELTSRESGSNKRGKAEKRGKCDKEALGGPIGTHPETTAQPLSESGKNVSVTGNNIGMDGEPADAIFSD